MITKFETVHDTAKKTMTHKFHDRLSLTLDFGNYELIVVKDGEVIERQSVTGIHFSLTEYEEILLMAEEAANKLNRFK